MKGNFDKNYFIIYRNDQMKIKVNSEKLLGIKIDNKHAFKKNDCISDSCTKHDSGTMYIQKTYTVDPHFRAHGF